MLDTLTPLVSRAMPDPSPVDVESADDEDEVSKERAWEWADN